MFVLKVIIVFAPELVYRCKVTKYINALQAFFQFLPNYFQILHSSIFVKSYAFPNRRLTTVLHTVMTSPFVVKRQKKLNCERFK